MKNSQILLVGINAKYIHSNLAIRYLQKYTLSKNNYNCDILEFTINQQLDYIVQNIYAHRPKIICFSCYIWNINTVLAVTSLLKKVLSDTIIICGGPEVSYNAKTTLLENDFLDYVISGEGEQPFFELTQKFLSNQCDFQTIEGIVSRTDETPSQAKPLPLDDIPFVYDKQDMTALANKIIYYESSRGCPFNCSYCLSSSSKGVRFLSFERLKSDLGFFLNQAPPQVKFVDRTFNADKKRACDIWQFLIENDNGVTNFHFEIACELLDEQALALLKGARNGLFQFEIGVQSTNPQTLRAINRNFDFNHLSNIVEQLHLSNNIHLHLDLIAGLPFEDYQSFKKSFNDVFALKPQQLQLGFLKVLKGTDITEKFSEAFDYSPFAPYEILYTDVLNYAEIIKLKQIEELVDTFYNSGIFSNTLTALENSFDNGFELFESFSRFYNENLLFDSKLSLNSKFDVLVDFAKKHNLPSSQIETAVCDDLFAKERVKKLPLTLSHLNLKELKLKYNQA